MSRSARQTPILLACALALFLLADCRSQDAEAKYAEARKEYDALLFAGHLPTDPEFDGVIARLREVPDGAPQHAKAQELVARILRARAPRPPIPLATPGYGDAGMDVLENTCAELAQRMGAADAGERADWARKVEACHNAIEHVRDAQHHATTPDSEVAKP